LPHALIDGGILHDRIDVGVELGGDFGRDLRARRTRSTR
jgi:hypothetical protein